MAETLFSLVSTAILAIINEADQASDNKEKLQILSSLAKSIQPMLPDIQLKLQAPEMMNALSMLQTSLESVGLVIRERGGPRSKLRLPIDSVTGFAAKVQAEISGAQQSLTNAIMAIQLALQMKVLKVVEDQQGSVEKLLREHVANFQDKKTYPWEISFSMLKYEQNSRGGPADGIIKGSGGFGKVFAASLTDENGHVYPVAVKEPHDPTQIHYNDELREQFDREVVMMLRLRHPNLLGLIGTIRTDQKGNACYMIITQLLPMSLATFVSKKPEAKSADLQVKVIRGIADGLAPRHQGFRV